LDKQFIQIFKKVINDYGLGICNDTKKLNSLLADYSKGDYYKERHLIVWVLEANKNNILKVTNEYNFWKNQSIKYLLENEFIDKERASWALDVLFNLLFGHKYYVDRGFYLINKNKLKEANLLFDNAIILSPTSSDAYHGKGIIALKDKDFDKTIEYFNKAITYDKNKLSGLSSDLSKVYFERGNISLTNNNFNFAISDFLQSIKYNKDINTYKYLAICYNEISDYKNEEIALNSALALENNNIELLLKHAKVCFQLQRYNDSINNYTTILQVDKNRIDVYELRSQVYYKIKNFQDAIDDINTILCFEPNNSDALYHLGLIYYTINDITKSQEYINQIESMDINSITLAGKIRQLKDKINIKKAEILEEEGDKYHNNNKTKEAIYAYTNAINFTPNQSRLYFKRAYLNIFENNLGDVSLDLSCILKYSSEEYEIIFANSFIYFFKNEYNKSLDNFMNLLKLKPSFYDYLKSYIAKLNRNLSQEYFENKDYEKVIKYLEAVGKYDNFLYDKNKPLIADTYNKFGDSLFANKIIKSAITNYKKSLSIIINNSIYFKLAQCYHALAEFNSEYDIYAILISIDPKNTEIYIKRSDTYFLLKEYDKALNDYNTILKFDRNNISIHLKCLNVYILQNDLTSAQIECDDILEIEPNNQTVQYIKQLIDHNSLNFKKLIEKREEWEEQTRYIEETKFDFGCSNCIYLHDNIYICKKIESYNAWSFTKQTARCHEYKRKQ